MKGAPGERPGPRRGMALALVLVSFGLVAVGVGVLWNQAGSMRGLARRTLAAEQARLLARSGLAHGLHKLERTRGWLEEVLAKSPGQRLDLGRERPEYLAECRGRLSLGAGEGDWHLSGLAVARRETTRGALVLEVSMEAVASVRIGDETRIERVSGEYRLYPGSPPEPGSGPDGVAP